ncbi:MAG: hypothetical protein ABL883_04430 [Terricaulis sp.]
MHRRAVLWSVAGVAASPAEALAQCRPTNRATRVSDARSALLREARADVGRNVGQDCKNWMRTVVARAIPGCVVPATSPNADGYMWAQSSGWSGMSAPLENLTAGQILQMRLFTRSGPIPHTSLVSARSRTSLTLVHSNFRITNTVTEDSFSFADFYNRIRDPGGTYRYSVYSLAF